MSEKEKESAAVTPVRKSLPTGRSRVGWYEPEIYIEDVLEHVPNKYLAVNLAAQRARQLNELELPVGEAAKVAKKPTTQALLELIEGHLTFERPATRPLPFQALPDEEAVDEEVDELLSEEAEEVAVEDEEEDLFEDTYEDEELDID
ncbi:MAG: hypothetical protein KatS3mg115_0806 [Candidatus Poribacteria bacterium]|nr:MAG: hypothetical protein KatS3mg115_0806 [Candidatus Poribacteria bacterium]